MTDDARREARVCPHQHVVYFTDPVDGATWWWACDSCGEVFVPARLLREDAATCEAVRTAVDAAPLAAAEQFVALCTRHDEDAVAVRLVCELRAALLAVLVAAGRGEERPAGEPATVGTDAGDGVVQAPSPAPAVPHHDDGTEMLDEARRLARAGRAELRRLAALVIATEGCGCCESPDHQERKDALAKALRVAKYRGKGGGYNWYRYAKRKP